MPLTSRAAVVVQGAEIPSVPKVLQEILERTRDPDASIAEIEELVRGEPGLVTRLLKTANSALYSFSKEVVSVRQAVVLLGFTTLRSLVSGLALIDAFHNFPGLDQDYVFTVWRRSLASAGIAAHLAKRFRLLAEDEAFLSAIVHDAGHIVMDQYFQEAYRDLRKERPFPPPARERALFETDHAEVGSLLLEGWNFPPAVVETVRSHHRPLEEPSGPGPALVLLGDFFASRTKDLEDLTDRPEEEVPGEILKLLEKAGLSWRDLSGEGEELARAAETSRRILEG